MKPILGFPAPQALENPIFKMRIAIKTQNPNNNGSAKHYRYYLDFGRDNFVAMMLRG
jgi:hypothetical protein